MSAYAVMCSKRILTNYIKLLNGNRLRTDQVVNKCCTYDENISQQFNRSHLRTYCNKRYSTGAIFFLNNFNNSSNNNTIHSRGYSKSAHETSSNVDGLKTIDEKSLNTLSPEKEGEKKESRFGGKNAWKWGMLSLGFFAMYFGGVAVYIWGE